MPKFFVPGADSPEQAERVLRSMAEFNKMKIPSPRIYSFSYTHNGRTMKATVGEPLDPYYRESGDIVAILEGTELLGICTANRGVLRGEPVLVGSFHIGIIHAFDDPQDSQDSHQEDTSH